MFIQHANILLNCDVLVGFRLSLITTLRAEHPTKIEIWNQVRRLIFKDAMRMLCWKTRAVCASGVLGSYLQASYEATRSAMLGKSESHERIIRSLFGDFGMSPGGNDQILFAIDAVRHGCGVATRRKLRFP